MFPRSYKNVVLYYSLANFISTTDLLRKTICIIQRSIQKPVKHLRRSILQKKVTAKSS